MVAETYPSKDLLNLGLPKSIIVWKRNQRFGAKTCVIAVAAEKYPYRLSRRKSIPTEKKQKERKKEIKKRKRKRKKIIEFGRAQIYGRLEAKSTFWSQNVCNGHGHHDGRGGNVSL